MKVESLCFCPCNIQSSKLVRRCVYNQKGCSLAAPKLANGGIAEVNLRKKLFWMERMNMGQTGYRWNYFYPVFVQN